MKKLLLVFTFTFGLLSFSFAQQGLIQLPATGQTTSYYPGDDGDLQMGIPIPENRFTEHGNGTATDELTALMWVLDGNLMASRDPEFDQDRIAGDGDVNWGTALDYIQKLNTESFLGYNDWRMPNFLELLSLVNLEYDSISLPGGNPFSNLKSGYWSSTTNDRFRTNALAVYLKYYIVHPGITYPSGHWESLNKDLGEYTQQYYKLFLMPVRDGAAGSLINLPETGQERIYFDGDDGYWRKGASWPSPRFVDYNTGEVIDNLTGLMWTKDSHLMFTRDIEFDTSGTANGKVPWITAIGYINKLNNEAYLGYNDWRLPNRNELASLIDYSRNNTCLPKNHPFTTTFPYAHPGEFGYWTSSTISDVPGQAWSFSFSFSELAPNDKNADRVVWPVRTVTTPAPTGSIKGYIIGDDIPKDKIEISLSGQVNARTETNSDGYYEFLHLPDGNYTIEPFFEYFNILPDEKTLNVSGTVVNCDFEAAYNRAYGWVEISDNLFSADGYYCSNLNDVYFINENEGWITSMQDIYHTTDGGLTFEKQSIQREGDYPSAVFMLNESVGYSGSSGGVIFKTVNGGDEWTMHGSAGNWITDIDFPPDSDIGYCTGDNGTFCQIDPDGISQIETGLNGGLPSVSSVSNTCTYYAGTVHRLYHYDGNEITDCCMWSGSVASIYFQNDSIGWAAMDVVGIIGLHGIAQYNCAPLRGYDEDPYVRLSDIHSPNGKDIWLVGHPGSIIYSPNANDFSFTWPDQYNNTVWNRQAKDLTQETLRSVYFISPTCGYAAGNNGTLLKYTQLPGAPQGADILGVHFPGQYGKEVINTADRTVNVEVADSIDITYLVPEIYISAEAVIDPPSGTGKDFTNPVTYTVTSPDNTTKIWTVSVTKVFGIHNPNEEDHESFFDIYPNPCWDKIQISNSKLQNNSPLNPQPSKLEIIDLHGKVVYEEEMWRRGVGEISVNVSHLPRGLYLVKLQTEKAVGVRKIIIQ